MGAWAYLCTTILNTDEQCRPAECLGPSRALVGSRIRRDEINDERGERAIVCDLQVVDPADETERSTRP